jgi:uncharacterized protein (UPF0264 family)
MRITIGMASDNGVELVIINDVRFQNELEYVKGLGAYTIRMHRSSCEEGDKHISETELDSAKFNLNVNNISLKNLEEVAKIIAKKL